MLRQTVSSRRGIWGMGKDSDSQWDQGKGAGGEVGTVLIARTRWFFESKTPYERERKCRERRGCDGGNGMSDDLYELIESLAEWNSHICYG